METYPFSLEYRFYSKPLSAYYVLQLNKTFPEMDYDPIRNMIVVVSSYCSHKRKNNIMTHQWPKLYTKQDVKEFMNFKTLNLFYPCGHSMSELDNGEKKSIYELQKDRILGKLLIDDGNWYQIYEFPMYSEIPCCPIEGDCEIGGAFGAPNVLKTPLQHIDRDVLLQNMQNTYQYSVSFVYATIYSICMKPPS
jgi:hypothetical protein